MATPESPKTLHLSVLDESSAQNALRPTAAEVVHALSSEKKKKV
jgi:hypothetical protein